ncbi:hypothetical protein MRS44_011355 [Fusarium solani]|uniref:uncharacterized protein n=1 Tax=Fusarium solani TaxID=169388 RepID=UPI0032C440EA|nr:hypothetical protein MRS44_011355 [Fusarium solani]
MGYKPTFEHSWRIVARHSPIWVARVFGSLWPSGKAYSVPRLSDPHVSSFEAESQCQEHTSRFSSGPVITAGMASALTQLPGELLLEVLKRLQLSSLYMLRQTCRRFRYLAEDHTLEDFRLEFLRSEVLSLHSSNPLRKAYAGKPRRLATKSIVCKDIAHLPLNLDDHTKRAMTSSCLSEIRSPLGLIPTYVTATKAIVLLHLDHRRRIDMDSIRQRLATQLKDSKQLFQAPFISNPAASG